jgi:predicted PurR-regulated permease PerM
VTETLASAIGGIAGFVSTILMALFLSLLVLLDLPNLERALSRWIPPAYHRESTLLIHQIGYVWNGFFRGQALIAFILTLLTWLQLTLMGVQNAVAVAVFCGVISLIPTLGGILALVPIAAISLLQGSTVFTGLSNGTFAILVVIVNLAISQIIWNVVAPKILGDAVNLPLPVIIVGIFIGAALGGILGAFLITPIIGTVRVITVYLLKKIERQDPFPGQEPSGAPLGSMIAANRTPVA